MTPSYGVPDTTMIKIINFIEKDLNLNYKLRPHWRCEYHPLYASCDALRFESLTQALMSNHKVIWAARGGSGMTSLMPRLKSWMTTLVSPPSYKLLIGFSDITALHLLLHQEWGWPTLHGPTLACLTKDFLDETSIESLKKFLSDTAPEIYEENLRPLNDAACQESLIEGSLIGGNHSLVQYSLGTWWQLNSHNKILFLEDVNEVAYRIDARLQHLDQAGLFQGIKALILGDFNHRTSSIPEEIFKTDYVLQTFAKKLSIPVFKMLGYGHTSQNKPLILGFVVAKVRNAP
ncbi:MAG: S66 peptidase family protein [Janthinobacterium lividum]